MITFKQYINEAHAPGTILSFGATAYGNADIDTTTASEIKQGILKTEWQFMGNKGNKITPGYSVANNVLPHGTIIKVIDKRTGQPVGAQFGNAEGIFKVEDTGGSNVSKNIDFYSGSNKQMMQYFANLGKNTNNLQVEVLNIKPGSAEEQQILAQLQQGTTPAAQVAASDQAHVTPTYNTMSDALQGLQQGIGIMASALGGGIK